MSTSKESISYVMVNNIETLQKLVEQMQTVETPNFTRLVLSFVQLSLPKYEDNNLPGTGIFGYYIDTRSSLYEQEFEKQQDQGAKDFEIVKGLIKTLQDHKLEVFVASGGWDYSCNPELYCKSLVLYKKVEPSELHA